MENFFELLLEPLRRFWEGFAAFVPNLLAMAIIIGAGVFISWVVKVALLRAFKGLDYDRFCEKAGITAAMQRARLPGTPSELTGRVVFWFLVLVFAVMGLSALRLPAMDGLVSRFFVSYLPRIFSAAIILFVGYVIAGFLGRAVLIASVNRGYHYSKLIAESVRLLIVVLVIAMALEQLNIAPGVVVAAFSIVFGGIVLALSIAFGAAGIETAKRIIEGGLSEEKKEEKAEKEEKEEKEKKGRDMEHI